MKRFILSIFTFFIMLALNIPVTFAGIPKVIAVETNSAITPWFIEDHYLPIISVRLTFTKTGNAYDPETKMGLAVLVAGLLDEGAGDFNATEFQEKLEEIATNISFESDNDNFYVSLTTQTANLSEALNLLELSLRKPKFDEDAIARVKQQLQVLIQKSAEDPEYIAAETLKQKLYGNHPYGRPPYGTTATIDNITRTDLIEFTKNSFAKDNLQVSIVGDLSTSEVKKLIKKYFSYLPEQAKIANEITPVNFNVAAQSITLKMDIPQSVIVFGKPGILRNDPNFYPAYILNHILGGGGFESRLVNEIREKRGLAYSVYSYLQAENYAGVFAGGAGVSGNQAKKTVSLIKQELQKAQEQGITQAELDDAKGYLIDSFPLKMTKNAKLAAFLSVMQSDNLGIDFLEKRNGYVENVTLEQVNAFAKSLLNQKDMIFVTVGQ